MAAPNPNHYEFPEALGAIIEGADHGAETFLQRVVAGFHKAEQRRKQLAPSDPEQLDLDLRWLEIKTPAPEPDSYLRPLAAGTTGADQARLGRLRNE